MTSEIIRRWRSWEETLIGGPHNDLNNSYID